MEIQKKNDDLVIINDLVITPKLIQCLSELKNHDGPKIKDEFAELCLTIAATDTDSAISVSDYTILASMHSLLLELFNNENISGNDE